MNLLVCVKRVPAPGARIVLTEDGLAIDTRHLGFTVSPHEECAVEEAVRLVERHGGTSTVMTLGPDEAQDQLRTAISMGVDRGVHLPIEELEWDASATAAALVDAVRTLETDQGAPFDLILVGNESADAANHQVGIRLAHGLVRPVVAGAKGIDPSDGMVRVERPVDDGVDVYELAMPAIVSVKEGINLPRYPSMRGRLAAKKASIRQLEPTRADGGVRTLGFRHATQPDPEPRILGHGPEAAPAVVAILEEVGLL
jgi:electron transfer flavoprotein beta subunit